MKSSDRITKPEPKGDSMVCRPLFIAAPHQESFVELGDSQGLLQPLPSAGRGRPGAVNQLQHVAGWNLYPFRKVVLRQVDAVPPSHTASASNLTLRRAGLRGTAFLRGPTGISRTIRNPSDVVVLCQLICSPQSGPAAIRVLWDDLN